MDAMRAKPTPPPSPLENYRAAVAANPHSAEAHTNLGWGLYGQKQLAEAAQAFQEAIRLDAYSFEAHYGLGLTHKAAGAKAEAEAEFRAAHALTGQLENQVRGQMLKHLLHAHINQLNTGDWGLDQELHLHV
jgi:Tfp pilus assembly protein PilF